MCKNVVGHAVMQSACPGDVYAGVLDSRDLSTVHVPLHLYSLGFPPTKDHL